MSGVARRPESWYTDVKMLIWNQIWRKKYYCALKQRFEIKFGGRNKRRLVWHQNHLTPRIGFVVWGAVQKFKDNLTPGQFDNKSVKRNKLTRAQFKTISVKSDNTWEGYIFYAKHRKSLGLCLSLHNPGDLWPLEHWLQFWQLRTWIHDWNDISTAIVQKWFPTS